MSLPVLLSVSTPDWFEHLKPTPFAGRSFEVTATQSSLHALKARKINVSDCTVSELTVFVVNT